VDNILLALLVVLAVAVATTDLLEEQVRQDRVMQVVHPYRAVMVGAVVALVLQPLVLVALVKAVL
jgi:hypothetical protein